jgi:hypothetical protein
MALKPLTFADIMERDLYYYDPSREDVCRQFCEMLRISYLPALSDRASYFSWNVADDCFEGPHQVGAEVSVSIDDDIFHPSVLKKFGNHHHNVLFVLEEKRLAGVVHIADYNKNAVLLTYYAFLLDFEKKLRELLIFSNKTNDDIIDYYKRMIDVLYGGPMEHCRRQYNDYMRNDKKIKMMEALGPFQAFPIADLMYYAREQKILDIELTDIQELKELRNSTMHGQDVVGQDERLFSIESMEKHFMRIGLFQKYYSRLKQRLATATHDELVAKNRAKLDMLDVFDRPVVNGRRLMWHYLDQSS